MNALNTVLLILHFLGLAMGFSVGLSNIVMQGLIAKAAPTEIPVLARFSPAMSRVGDTGLTLLWVTGLTLVFTKYGGFAIMPWQFHVKLTAVVILTALVGYVHVLMRKARNGDVAAAARLPKVGPLVLLAAITAVVFAVLTFD
jgi:predicted ferric reductase